MGASSNIDYPDLERQLADAVALHKGAKPNLRNGWNLPCPLCNANASINIKDGRFLAHCYSSGCADGKAILEHFDLRSQFRPVKEYRTFNWREGEYQSFVWYYPDYVGDKPDRCDYLVDGAPCADPRPRHKHVWMSGGSIKGIPPRTFGKEDDGEYAIALVEGELCAESASLLDGYIGATWIGGARNAKLVSDADWRKLTDGRRVVIWPDNDASGISAKALERVAGIIAECAQSIRVVDVSALDDGQDIKDVPSDEARRLLDEAQEWEPKAHAEPERKSARRATNAVMADIEDSEWEVRWNAETRRRQTRSPLDTNWLDTPKDSTAFVQLGNSIDHDPNERLDAALKRIAVNNIVYPEDRFFRDLARHHEVPPDAVKPEELLYAVFRPDTDQTHPQVIDAAGLLMFSFIERRLNPGCKLDNMTLLVGFGGIGKSKLWQLISDYRALLHSGPVSDVTPKRLLERMRRKRVFVWDEIKTHYRHFDQLKGIVSDTEDVDREAYAHETTESPRHYGFGATTNRADLFHAGEDHRRWLTAQLKHPTHNVEDTEKLIGDNLMHLYAQVARRVLDGGTTVPTDETIQINRNTVDKHFNKADDIWMADIRANADIRKYVSVADAKGVPLKLIWESIQRARSDSAEKPELEVERAKPKYRNEQHILIEALSALEWREGPRTRSPLSNGGFVRHYQPPKDW